MAKGGLRYNQFHTTALCSPTRMALLTGRNHHSANTGSVMEVATAFPGNRGVRPRSVEPFTEMLRLNGYSTAAFGKYHETAPWEVSVSGPFDRWPTRSGFDKFYGFIGGETNMWAPPVEAIIALSIVFVAAEIIRGRQGNPGLTARAPWHRVTIPSQSCRSDRG